MCACVHTGGSLLSAQQSIARTMYGAHIGWPDVSDVSVWTNKTHRTHPTNTYRRRQSTSSSVGPLQYMRYQCFAILCYVFYLLADDRRRVGSPRRTWWNCVCLYVRVGLKGWRLKPYTMQLSATKNRYSQQYAVFYTRVFTIVFQMEHVGSPTLSIAVKYELQRNVCLCTEMIMYI